MSEPHITSVHSSPAKYYCSWHLFSLIYRVVCSQCKSGYVSCNPCSSEVDFIPRHKDLKSNMVTMKRLNAYSYYRFEVSWFMIVVYWFFLSFLILPHWTVQLSISTSTSTAGWWVSLSVASFDCTKGRTINTTTINSKCKIQHCICVSDICCEWCNNDGFSSWRG